MGKVELDVELDPSANPEKKPDVESGDDKGKDKDKNFAELRKKNEQLEKDLAEERRLRQEEANKRKLDVKEEDDDEDEEEDKDKDPKKSKSEISEATRLMFDRDMKKAVRSWNSKNKVTADEWAAIKKRVSLNGDELDSEIEEKIDAAYHSIPSVREKRDKELILKGKKEAMKEFQDEELDLGGGGDGDLGGGDAPRFNSKEKKWLDGFGVNQEARNKIDKSSDDHRNWKVLDPARK